MGSALNNNRNQNQNVDTKTNSNSNNNQRLDLGQIGLGILGNVAGQVTGSILASYWSPLPNTDLLLVHITQY